MKLNTALITAVALFASIANADVIVTKNGSTINGTIDGIDKGKITVKTEFAGIIIIDQAQVASFTTDNPIYVTTEDGSTYLGPVSGDNAGLKIASSSGELETNIAAITESWQPGTESPTALRHAAKLETLKRHWAYEAAFDYSGKTGNKTSNGLTASFRASLKGPDDKLEFFARTRFEDTDGVKSADDARAGVDYSNNFGKNYNWYVRSEFGRDKIKDIRMFSTAAAGFGYTFADTETRNLNVRGGLGYLFESYDDFVVLDDQGNEISRTPRESSNSASLDFGVFHKEVFKWGTLVNRLTYTPTIEDLANFRLNEDTSLELPLKVQGWSVRTGVSFTYDSQADLSGKEELDTTYYVRMVLKWL